MKKIFLGLCLFIFSGHGVMAQYDNKVAETIKGLNNDTVSYIRQYIVARKSSYVGKPLEDLLRDLPVVVRYNNDEIFNQKNTCPITVLYFSSANDAMKKIADRKNPLMITITWAIPFDNRQLPARGLAINGGNWTAAAYNFYKAKIIGSIETFKDDQ